MNTDSWLGQISDLPFKGARDYLHGTDTYNWLASLVDVPAAVSGPVFTLTFRRLIRHQMTIVRLEGKAADPQLVAEFSLGSGAGTPRYGLRETGIVPTRRVAYDEDGLVRSCVIEGHSIQAPSSAPATPVELCVAMTKALHQTAFAGEKRKWLFARLELARLFRPDDTQGLSVQIVQHVESRFSKSTLTREGEILGHIYFSVLP